jgi:hypothetical protein
VTLEPGLHWDPKWRVMRLRYGERGRNRASFHEIQTYLEEGWEPFAATSNQANADYLWLRRQR